MSGGRILITGATGFVGRRLVERLGRDGHALTLALRRASATPSMGGATIAEVGEIGPETRWEEALAGVAAVVHLAAHVHVAPERAAQEAAPFDRVNHLGTARLYAAAARAGVRRFVFVSSIMALGGRTEPGRPFDDATEPRPETPYGRSKLSAEQALARAAGPDSPELVVIRPPLICGPGVKANLATLARLAALPVPLPLGGLRNRRTLLSLDNLVDAVAAALPAGGPTGTFVLGDRTPVSTSDIVRHLAAGMGRRARLFPAPVGLLRWGAGFVGLAGHAQRLFGDLEVDSSGFRRAFGWTDLVETGAALEATGAGLAPVRAASRSARDG